MCFPTRDEPKRVFSNGFSGALTWETHHGTIVKTAKVNTTDWHNLQNEIRVHAELGVFKNTLLVPFNLIAECDKCLTVTMQSGKPFETAAEKEILELFEKLKKINVKFSVSSLKARLKETHPNIHTQKLTQLNKLPDTLAAHIDRNRDESFLQRDTDPCFADASKDNIVGTSSGVRFIDGQWMCNGDASFDDFYFRASTNAALTEPNDQIWASFLLRKWLTAAVYATDRSTWQPVAYQQCVSVAQRLDWLT